MVQEYRVKTTTQVLRNDELDLIAFLRVLWNSKLIVLTTMILFVLASIYIAFSATEIYRAEVAITRAGDAGIGSAASLAGQLGGLVGVDLKQGGQGRDAQAILKSRRLAEEFITRSDYLSELASNEGDVPTLWRAVKHFRELVLSINENDAVGITTVSIEWVDPVIAARWANEYVTLANDIIRTRARDESERNIEYLKHQIEQTTVVALQGVMYNLVEAETKTVMLANARADYAFTIVDPAVAPEIRTKPRRKLILLSGGTLGFFVGVFVAFAIRLIRQVRVTELPKPS